MKINFLYKGKDYNFDIPKDTTIDYINKLSSRITHLNKVSFDLLYNNQKIEKNNKALIENFIPKGEKDTMLTVEINKNQTNSKRNKKLMFKKSKELSIKQKKHNFENEENKISFDKCNINNNSENINKIIQKNIDNDNENEIDKKFETNFTKKNNILLSLIKEFNQKIKDIYINLIDNYIKTLRNKDTQSSLHTNRNFNNDEMNNYYIHELTVFESKLMDFQDNQIKYFSQLLKFLKKYDNNEILLKLKEFYNILILNNNLSNKNNNINNKEKNSEIEKPLKLRKMESYKFMPSNISTTNSLTSINIISNKLPILKNKNSINNSVIIDKNINHNNIRNSFLKQINNKQISVTEQINIKNENNSKIKDEPTMENNIIKEKNNNKKDNVNENYNNIKKQLLYKEMAQKTRNKGINLDNDLNSSDKLLINDINKNIVENILNKKEIYNINEKEYFRHNSIDNFNNDISNSEIKKPIIIEKDDNIKANIIEKESPQKNKTEIKNIINNSLLNINESKKLKNIMINSKKKSKKKPLNSFDFMI